jgi:two-component system cell cycle sensor histidine kinase/response regulator CckA
MQGDELSARRAGEKGASSSLPSALLPEQELLQVLGAALEGVRDFVARVDLDGRFVLQNRSVPSFLAPTPRAESLYDMFDPACHGALRRCLEQVAISGKSSAEHVIGRGTLGPYSHYRVLVSPVRTERVVGYTVVATEITSARHAAEAIEESETKLRVAARAIGMGLFSVDVQQDRASWDPTMYAILGQEREPRAETLAAYLRCVHPDDRKTVARALDRIIESGEFEDLEHRVLHAEDEVRWVLCKGAVVRDAEERVVKLVGGVLDITERRALEERMRHAQKMDAVGQLTAGIAHNFNNMLAGMVSSVELALRDASPRSRTFLENTRDAAERAARMVRQLLLFAGNHGEAERRLEDVGLVVRSTVDFFRATLDRRVELVLTVDPRLPRIPVDAAQLEQSVLNVLINARDAVESVSGARPRISVQVSAVETTGEGELTRFGSVRDGAYVVIRIADNGAGMDAEIRRRIFEPFFTTKETGRGTGLGLAMVYGVLREHEGFVECESAPRQGTTFWLGLPVAEGPLFEPDRRDSGELDLSLSG